MSYLKIAVSHPDFERQELRAAFADGLLNAWSSVMESQSMEDRQPPDVRSPGNTVDVYIEYGDEVDRVRNAERAAAAMMLSVSYGVVMSNGQKTQPTLLAYGFAIERDVELEEIVSMAHEEPPAPAEARTPQS